MMMVDGMSYGEFVTNPKWLLLFVVVVVVDDDGICPTFDASEIRRENHLTCMKPVVQSWGYFTYPRGSISGFLNHQPRTGEFSKQPP